MFGKPVDYDEENSHFVSSSSYTGQAICGLIPGLWVPTISPEPFSQPNQSVLFSRYIKYSQDKAKGIVSLAHGTINELVWTLLPILYLSPYPFPPERRDSKLKEPSKSNGLGVRGSGGTLTNKNIPFFAGRMFV